MRVADYIFSRLIEEGIEHVYMITGRGILYLSDAAAAASKNGKIDCVSTHHEQSAGFAAIAEAQLTENAGLAMVSTGCGATNAMTSVLCAYQDSVPVMFISGQNHLNQTVRHTKLPIRTYGSQEADIVALVEPITKYAVMLEEANSVVLELEKCIYYMKEGRKGPAWLDVPLDLQNARIDDDILPSLIDKAKEEIAKLKEDNSTSSMAKIDEALKLISQASRPVFLIGSGVRSSGAVECFCQLVERTRIPVIFAPSAADTYGSGNKYSIGAVGALGGTREGNLTMANADLIVSIGCSLPALITGENPDTFAREAKLVVVDIDRIQHEKSGPTIDLYIDCDAKCFIDELAKKIDANEISERIADWTTKCLLYKESFPLGKESYDEDKTVDLYYLAKVLSDELCDDAVVVSDAGFEELIIPSGFAFKDGQRLVHPAAQGSMGFALGAAVGAAKTVGHDVYVVVGDGSVMMNLQELQTIVYNQLPVKIIITNNNMYSVITRRQQDLFRTRTIGTNETNGVSAPKFEKVADCFGLNYIKAENAGDLVSAVAALKEMEGPTILEVMCDPNQRYLHQSFGKNMEGKMARKPIEDLSPFLDREVFLDAMVIPPVEA